ncbi:tetratricopeptide repeat (TPR)-like superfamily protein [Actinidia rufa]|uniref:Tetratricopeptide repeat (TPR)-like superfamily protein n=1 Tax=Actinidia rufa TaxID=165716 RepID=A0A7J0GXG9_9ERIC|nr:tetratricopeptide repeat (TPR)-like superfamily protein [Actinidia rufa]
MRALLIRTGSVPVHQHSLFPGSPSVPPSQRNLSLHLDVSRRKDSSPATGIRRAFSEADVIRSDISFSRLSGVGTRSFPERIPEERFPAEELGFPGGGIGDVEVEPYGLSSAQKLRKIEGDAVRAEEYYGRAILASPGDGEVLALYGSLIWETYRDEDRAKSYFDRAYGVGSYAHFMWEAEGEEGGGDGGLDRENDYSAAMLEAF